MKKVISIALALLMVAVMLPVMAMAVDNVAKIGTTEYTTLKDAVDAVTDGTATEIKLLGSCEGVGIVIPEGRNITIDFCGFTYTVSGDPLAGSSGTQNQCFQLLKNSTIKLKNGKIVANNSGILRMIQNYSDLTLDNMTLDATVGTNSLRDNTSLICNDCGHTTIKDTTIVTKTDAGIAIDVEYWASRYPQGGSVSIGGASDINGKVRYIVDDPADEDAINRANSGNLRLSIDSGRVGGIVNHNGGVSANIEISGGTFNTDVRPYVDSEFVVTDGNNYYVGDAAQNAVRNATSGELTVLNAGRGVAFNDVKPGVTIVNNSRATIIVNGNEVAPEKSYTVPGAPIIIYTPDNEPAILSGANQVVAPGAAATFRIDEEYDRLLAVAVDGVTLDKSNYEAWSGSTYIKLLPKFMKTLSVGTHTLTAYFTSHTVSTTFTISEGAKNPATGANDFVGVAAAMAVVSLLGAAAVIRKK